MWGVDNTYLSRAVDGGVFEPYEAAGLDDVPAEFAPASVTARPHRWTSATCASTTTSPGSPSTTSTRPPTSPTLADPAYRDLLVVEDPATSSPGLAFLLATIAEYGDDGWAGLLVTPRRQRGGGRRRLDRGLLRPLQRRRRRRPPAGRELRDEPAGRGAVRRSADRRADHRGHRRHLLPSGRVRRRAARHRCTRRRRTASSTSSIPERFQSEIALNLFVYPANATSRCRRRSPTSPSSPTDPATLDPATIAAHRQSWIGPGPTSCCGERRQPPAAVAGAAAAAVPVGAAGGVLRLAVR